jgi:hypothetical protein
MKNRYVAFGYQLTCGTVTPRELEAEIVRTVFRQYITGDSYKQIAAALEKAGYPYSEGTTHWNKNMVGRILQNRRYLGQDGYPILIKESEFRQAALLQQEKYTRRDIRTAPEVAALKGKVICGECGKYYERITDNRVGEKWRCKNAECSGTVKITDTLLTGQVTDLLNYAIVTPTIIEIPSLEIRPRDIEVTRLTNEINRELDKTDCDEEYVKILIMARAAAQYAICSDGHLPIKARELRAAFESHEPATSFDMELFECAVDAVIVQPDGTVYLILKNEQHLKKPERSTTPC